MGLKSKNEGCTLCSEKITIFVDGLYGCFTINMQLIKWNNADKEDRNNEHDFTCCTLL